MAKPSNVGQWDSTLVNVVEPTTEKTVGWTPGQVPTAQTFNWFQNTAYLWHKYLNDDAMGAGGIVDTLLTRTVTSATPYIAITNAGAGAAINGAGSSGAGIYGTSDTGNGGYFRSSSTAGGSAVYGYASGATGSNIGGSFTATSGYGVFADGSLIGAIGSGATGLQGQGVTRGGNFTASNTVDATNAYGVHSSCISAGTGLRVGVYGIGNTYGVSGASSVGTGVHGESTGSADATDYYGVYGVVSGAGTGARVGVYGEGKQYGVKGLCSGSGYGGYFSGDGGACGISGSTTRAGVYGQCTSSAAGVRGEAATGYGVHGTSTSGAGVYGASTTGVGGQFVGNATRGPINIGTLSSPPSGFGDGDMYIDSSLGKLRFYWSGSWHTVTSV